MSHVMECPCGQRMTVEDSHIGLEVLCVNCRQKLEVPPPSTVPGQPALARPVNTPKDPGSVFVNQDPATAYQASYGGWYKPHRGGWVLTFGILGLMGCCCCLSMVFSILALVLGLSDLGEMKKGVMDPSGQTLTTVGVVLGAVGVILAVVGGILGPIFGGLGELMNSGFMP